jgi:hypothetical protein
MILAFVRAEAFSARFGATFRRAMGGKQAVYNPDLSDPAANALRRHALAAIRGYGQCAYLFRGWPHAVNWKLVAVTVEELGAFLYANHPTWTTLTHGSRLVRDGAANVETVPTHEEAKPNILAVERDVRRGQTYPPLIATATDKSAQHVLVEGHTRATAYVRVLERETEVEVIVGYAPAITGWLYF